jgi:hypothetical protein
MLLFLLCGLADPLDRKAGSTNPNHSGRKDADMLSETIRKWFSDNGYTEAWGDVNLIPHGGLFVKDTGNQVYHIVELIDLDSGAGVSGAMLVESGVVCFDCLKTRDLKAVYRSMDTRRHVKQIAKTDKQRAMICLVSDIWQYGIRETEESILYIDNPSDYRHSRQQWPCASEDTYTSMTKALRRVTDTN